MAKIAKGRKKAYHCDGYYFPSVCRSRGQQDAADEHGRYLCNTHGLDEKDRLCSHCVENRKFFRATPRRLSTRVSSLTPYQAKNAEAVTIKAWSKPQPLVEYLKENPSLYGVDVRTGQLIHAPAVENG